MTDPDEKEAIKTAGPPEPKGNKPAVVIALAELFRRLDVANKEIANIRLEALELRNRTEGK